LRSYPQPYARFRPRKSLINLFLALANRVRCCSNNQVDAVFGSKHRGLRIGMRRNKGSNHGAPDTSVSGAYSFQAPRHRWRGFFYARKFGRFIFTARGTDPAGRRYVGVIYLFGGES